MRTTRIASWIGYRPCATAALASWLCLFGCGQEDDELDFEGTALPLTAAACDAVDWASAPLLSSTEAAPAITELRASVVEETLCVRVAGAGIASAKYNLLIETDGKLSTGLQSNDWVITGGDFFVQNGRLIRAGSPFFDDKNRDLNTLVQLDSVDPNILSLAITHPEFVPHRDIGLGLQIIDPATNASTAHVPMYPALARISGGHIGDVPRSEQCHDEGTELDPAPIAPARPVQAKTIRSGMIAPIYLPFPSLDGSDAMLRKDQWQRVAEAAAVSGSEARPDYFVVINGIASAPPSDAEWPAAREAWQPVIDAKVPLIGYVHTLAHHKLPDGTVKVGPDFRPLKDVEAEISSWISHLGAIEGIWLDEFYPRYEIAPADVAGPSPNPSLKPSDPNLDRFASQLDLLQVDATCGYYHRLTRWIRASYPGLRIIGNPGGRLYSNQRQYARLVDVLASFEGSVVDASASEWSAMRQAFEPLAAANLALLHAGRPNDPRTVERRTAIDKALEIGFSHVYATDSLYDSGKTTDSTALGTFNVWGNLPTDALGSSANMDQTPSTTKAISELRAHIATQKRRAQ